MLGLMKYVLRGKDNADITMTAFRKQITHKSTRIRVVQHVANMNRHGLSPGVLKYTRTPSR